MNDLAYLIGQAAAEKAADGVTGPPQVAGGPIPGGRMDMRNPSAPIQMMRMLQGAPGSARPSGMAATAPPQGGNIPMPTFLQRQQNIPMPTFLQGAPGSALPPAATAAEGSN